MAGWVLSPHAIQRALEMGVTGDEIREAFETPEDVRWSSKHGTFVYTRGRIALAVNPDRALVCTVLWASRHDWRLDYARGGDLGNRRRRSSSEMKHLRSR